MNENANIARWTAACAAALMVLLPGSLGEGAPAPLPSGPSGPLSSPQSLSGDPLRDILRLVDDTIGPIIVPPGGIGFGTGETGEVFDAVCNYVEPPKPTGAPGRSRPSLRVGINDYGTFGVDPSTGFQMPIGAANENLAVGWWGEGYLVDFTGSGGVKTHYPSGPSAGVTRIDDFWLDSAEYVTYRVTVFFDAYETDARDDGLLADFEFTLDKETCDVTLRTTLENQADYWMDVDYKRVVDWDNLDNANAGGGFFVADWQQVGTSLVATRSLLGVPHYECRTTATGITLPWAYDLWAWDDLSTVGPGGTWISPFYTGDGNAGFNFHRNLLPPGGTWDTFLVYDCSFLT